MTLKRCQVALLIPGILRPNIPLNKKCPYVEMHIYMRAVFKMCKKKNLYVKYILQIARVFFFFLKKQTD